MINDTLRAFHVQETTSVALIGAVAITAREWHHAALVVAGTAVTLYLDGVAVTTNTVTNIKAAAATAYVGSYSGGERLNGQIDDFAIINRALTAGDVLSIYESNAPIFAETARYSFRATPRGLVWADDEGLWMRDVSGNAVFGIYGGEAATKSWGGQVMAVGDLLIGRGSQYVLWDNSAGTMIISGSMIITGGSGYANLTDTPDSLSDINAGEGSKLTGIEAGATVGATWNTNLSNIPLRFGNSATTAGLYLTASNLGFYERVGLESLDGERRSILLWRL